MIKEHLRLGGYHPDFRADILYRAVFEAAMEKGDMSYLSKAEVREANEMRSRLGEGRINMTAFSVAVNVLERKLAFSGQSVEDIGRGFVEPVISAIHRNCEKQMKIFRELDSLA
jgi:hypothetical protein